MTTPDDADASSTAADSSAKPAPRGWLARIKGQLEKREFLRHFLTLMTGTGLAQVLQMAGMLLVARFFTDAQFGVYVAIMSVSSAILPIAALRYDVAIVLPERANDARQLVRLSTWINTAVALVTVVATAVAAQPLGEWLKIPVEDRWLIWLVGPITWLLAQVALLTFWLTRTKNFRTVSENKIVNAVALTLTQIGAGLMRSGVMGLMLASVLGQALTLANILRRTKGQLTLDRSEPITSMRQLARDYQKMPLLNGPNALVDSVRVQGIPLLIAANFAVAATGQFGMAWRLLQAPISLINGAIQQIFFQRIASTRRGQMSSLIRTSVKRSFLLGLAPFALIWLLAPWLLPLVLGAQWRMAGEIARLLVPWLFANFITSPISTVFVVAKRQGLLLAYALVFAAVPLGILWNASGDLPRVISQVAWAMTALLVIFIGLSLWVAHRYDHGPADPLDDDGVATTADGNTAVAVDQAEQIAQTIETAGETTRG